MIPELAEIVDSRDEYKPQDESKFVLNSGQIRAQEETFGMHKASKEISVVLGTTQGFLGNKTHPENLVWKCYTTMGVVMLSSLGKTNRDPPNFTGNSKQKKLVRMRRKRREYRRVHSPIRDREVRILSSGC